MAYLFAPALALIEDRLSDPAFSAYTLAETLGVDRSTVYRSLRAAGTTASDLVREARMARACQLLTDGTLVGDVAFRVGYEDVSSFSRAFRRHHGCPPSEWTDRAASR